MHISIANKFAHFHTKRPKVKIFQKVLRATFLNTLYNSCVFINNFLINKK